MRETQGHLLGGRLFYAQPQDGYRTGIEPVLLAASIPAQPGQRVLEAGTGAGAALMCLAARMPGLRGVGVEIDPDMAALARRNIAANGMDGFTVLEGDILRLALGHSFDHVFANPPWHHHASSPSPVARRTRAKQALDGAGASAWVKALSPILRHGGTLTLILPSPLAEIATRAMLAGGLPHVSRLKLLPKAGRPPKLVLLQGRADAGPGRDAPALVLHQADGRFTTEAERLLRDGAALAWQAPAGSALAHQSAGEIQG